ncbi:MAG: response regulator [Chloroflexota bacterium]
MTLPLALIVEDEPKLCQIFSLALKQGGFEIEVISDGQIASEKLATLVPYIVILDLHLPNISGKELLRQIRSDVRLADTKVMVVTADAAMADGLVDDSDLVLIKPVSFNQLRDLAIRLGPPDTFDMP